MATSNELDYFVNGEVFPYIHGLMSPSTINFFYNGEAFESVEYYADGVSGSDTSRVYSSSAHIFMGEDISSVGSKYISQGGTSLFPKITFSTSGSGTSSSIINIDMGMGINAIGKIRYIGATTIPAQLSMSGVDFITGSGSIPTESGADIFIGMSLTAEGGTIYSGSSTFITGMDLSVNGIVTHTSPTNYTNEYTQVVTIDHVHQNTNTKLIFLVEEDGVSLNISSATDKKLILTKPDHTSVILDIDFYTDGTDGKVAYTTSLSDLSSPGYYNHQVYVAIDGQQFYSDIGSFRVYSNILSV